MMNIGHIDILFTVFSKDERLYKIKIECHNTLNTFKLSVTLFRPRLYTCSAQMSSAVHEYIFFNQKYDVRRTLCFIS